MECSTSTVRIALKPKYQIYNSYFLAALDQILTLLNLTEDEFFITKKLARIVVEFAGKSDFNFAFNLITSTLQKVLLIQLVRSLI